jgi:segregation and condensation protein A
MVAVPAPKVMREDGQLDLFTGFPVKVTIFEGPLDLLLHLVKREEVDVQEVEIAPITESYLQYLRTMEQISVDFAAEFVVMAATLLLIKSRSLLPMDPTEEDIEEEAIEEAVTEEELKRRIEEYRSFKEAAEVLRESREMRQRIFLRARGDQDDIGTGFVSLGDVSVFDMVAAIQELLERAKPDPPHRVRRAPITIGEKITDIISRLRGASDRELSFAELVDEPTTKLYIIITFLAVLELIRRQRVRVHQEAPRGQILVQLQAGGAEA